MAPGSMRAAQSAFQFSLPSSLTSWGRAMKSLPIEFVGSSPACSPPRAQRRRPRNWAIHPDRLRDKVELVPHAARYGAIKRPAEPLTGGAGRSHLGVNGLQATNSSGQTVIRARNHSTYLPAALEICCLEGSNICKPAVKVDIRHRGAETSI